MVRSLVSKFKKLKSNWQPSYLRYGCLPIEEKTVLLEGGQGANINGNMFALAKELVFNPEFSEYGVIFVVTGETLEKAKERFAFYGMNAVRFVVRNSKAYCKALATAKFLVTDNTFPPYFHKREEQVYCNTWHGTPLKTLGYANKETLRSVNNVQKNFLASDIALFPNAFTKQVFMKHYALEPVFSGESLVQNYPRNGVFYNRGAGEEMKKRLGFENKRLFAYMPTFRENATLQLSQIRTFLKEWDAHLDEDSHLLINLHFVLASELNCEEYKHISYFPKEYETYEILNACDGLVTDYSSVFFDYAITAKPIVLFAYDKEEYLANRGTYFSLDSLPFPVTKTVEQTMEALSKPIPVPLDFLEAFCPAGGEDCAVKLLRQMFAHMPKETPKKELSLVYVGGITSAYMESLQHLIARDLDTRFVLVYRGGVSEKLIELSRLYQGRVTLLGLTNAFQFSVWERVLLACEKGKPCKLLKSFYKREANRLLGDVSPKRVIDFSGNHPIIAGILNQCGGEKFRVVHSESFPGLSQKTVVKKETKMGFAPIDLSGFQTERLKANPEAVKTKPFQLILPLYFNFGKKMICLSLVKGKTLFAVSTKSLEVRAGETALSVKVLGGKKQKKNHFALCKISLPFETAFGMPAKCEVEIGYTAPGGTFCKTGITYCTLPRNLFLGLRSPFAKNKQTKTTAVFRQSVKNQLKVFVRPWNVTDSIVQRLKQTAAYIASLLWHTKKAKSLVLLFEKNGEKYEESASVLYEELINSGYNNAYFVLAKHSLYWPRVAENYKKNILQKYSFRHYLYFFKAKTFIGTEAVVHAIDLQTYNLLALRKVGSKNINYVFLQHGVMYMVSLNSESRGMFGRKNLNGKYRVVVSSKEEANHFTTLGGHLAEDMYITGLPKFDRNIHHETADTIAIMPTWRPWEIAQAHEDFAGTGYCRMMLSLYENLPEHLKEKAVILPHPLVNRQLETLPKEITEKMVVNKPYDEILRETAVLITDYSSIAYDAFSRGARVIFDWSEKDACMQAYGPSTKLMLNETNVFGDVIYHPQQLAQIIEENYEKPQREEYQKRYETLVEFQDGNNTKRLMELLKKDGLI